jgi:Zn-dependent peptidase ImmA (M78 family)
MEISEATAVVRARAFIKRCEITSIPVDVQKCASVANAEIRFSQNLQPGEAGNTVFFKGRHLITVNAQERPERIRFTIFHEIAHIELGLPSLHGDGPANSGLFSYSKRPREEILCDIFAAECLVPWSFLAGDLKSAVPGLDFLSTIATKYEASLSCAASRVTEGAPFAACYVLSQDRFIKFVAYSAAMRSLGFWVSTRVAVPAASVSSACLKSNEDRMSGIVPGYVWTAKDGFSDIDLNEEAYAMRPWNQCITLIWMDDIDRVDLSEFAPTRPEYDGPPLLKELDGQLPWPGNRKRR